MKIMVFAVPAIKGGALSILEEFYLEVKNHPNKEIKWYFVVSEPTFEETENIKVLRFPWVKKSWFLRLYFDYLRAPLLLNTFKIDKIFSLQNIGIPFCKKEQVIYMHQALPFVNHKFKLTENKLFWVYQNIIGKKIFKSLKKAKGVIVQTHWIKDGIIKKLNLKPSKIDVVVPKIESVFKIDYDHEIKESLTFFYPSNAEYYKNHRIIIDSFRNLPEEIKLKYKVVFTINGDENNHIKEIKEIINNENLRVDFVGNLSQKEVFNYYSRSILIFPSYIETVGLPLLEVKSIGGIAIVSDTEFSREIFENYPNAYFFNAFDSKDLEQVLLAKEYLNYNGNIQNKDLKQESLVNVLLKKFQG